MILQRYEWQYDGDDATVLRTIWMRYTSVINNDNTVLMSYGQHCGDIIELWRAITVMMPRCYGQH